MPRSISLYLSDIQLAIADIQRFTEGKSLDDYL